MHTLMQRLVNDHLTHTDRSPTIHTVVIYFVFILVYQLGTEGHTQYCLFYNTTGLNCLHVANILVQN